MEKETVADPFRGPSTNTTFQMGPPVFEAGVKSGRAVVVRQLQSVPSSDTSIRVRTVPLEGLLCSAGQLKKYMLSKSLMAFISDKNLGISVVTHDWYVHQGTKFLESTEYEQIEADDIPWDGIIATCVSAGQDDVFPKNIRDFLIKFDRTNTIPVFHGIPKIHKSPWKFRPIVPMHTFATSKIAFVLHHYLDPIIGKIDSIIRSSRQFVKKLLIRSKNLSKDTWKMGTGDVTAMYSNIPTQELVNAVRGMLQSYSGYSPLLIRTLCRLIRFINENVFFQFNGQIYKQQKGIAMGLHCGPALANLYMASWEEWGVKGEDFLFYGRYIDDTFYLAPKGSDAYARVLAPKLEIIWQAGEEIPFLDVLVFKEPSGEIGVKPFFKPLNHYQYLPWNSGHPLSVKKGIVKTELLRYRFSSSRKKYFVEARSLLCTRLRRRGYPARVLKAWLKQVSWKHPLDDSSQGKITREPKELAKTEYNPVWNIVSLQPAWEEMTRAWDASGFTDRPFYDGITKSQNRTQNLWDLVRRLNKEQMPGAFTYDCSASEDSYEGSRSLCLRQYEARE